MSFTKFNRIAKETKFQRLLSKGLQHELRYTDWLKIYRNTTESSESVWAAALHSAFFTTSKKGLEQHMKQRIVRKVYMEPSSSATEQLSAKYL